MSQRDRSTVDVHFLAIQAEFLLDREILRGERLIHFNQINVIQRQPSLLKRHLRRGHRTASHHLRLNSSNAPAHNPPQSFCFSVLRRRDHHRSAAIDDSAGISGSDKSFLPECRFQSRQTFKRRIRTIALIAIATDVFSADLLVGLLIENRLSRPMRRTALPAAGQKYTSCAWSAAPCIPALPW